MENLLDFKSEEVIMNIRKFILTTLKSAGKNELVLGLSGGLDSAVASALAVGSIGAENVTAIFMPYETSSPKSLVDAKLMADSLGLKLQEIAITPMVDAYFSNYEPDASKLRRGNFMARQRMCVLFDHSAKENALVLGTSNRSELMLGYGTLYGDMASGLNPIGGLYKTQLRKVAQTLGVVEEILNKVPTGDLWPDQTDEGEMGLTYEEADEVLFQLYDKKMKREDVIRQHSMKLVEKIEKMVLVSEFKRNTIPIAAPFVAEI